MAVMRWDAASNAYVDMGGIRRFDKESGAWADCQEAKAQKEGAWQRVWPERPYLYNQGNECGGLTGGWVETPTFSKSNWWDNNGLDGRGSYVKKKSSGSLYVMANSGGERTAHASFHTGNRIDMARYTKLCAELEGVTMKVTAANGSNGISLVILDVNPSIAGANAATQQAARAAVSETVQGLYVLELDVSGFSGSYYVMVGAWCYKNGANATVRRVWLMP